MSVDSNEQQEQHIPSVPSGVRGSIPSPGSGNGHLRADMRAIQQACERGWAVKPEWREHLPKVAAQIAADPSTNERSRVAAIKVLLAMDRFGFDAACKLNEIYRNERMTLFGVATVTGDVVSFKKRDGTTEKIAVTVGVNGNRTVSTVT